MTLLDENATIEEFTLQNEKFSWLEHDDDEQARILRYRAYDRMYNNDPEVFNITIRDQDGSPVQIPKAKVVVNTTAYFLLKGLVVTLSDDANDEQVAFLDNFLKRELFYSRLAIAKRTGAARGDYVFHITADAEATEGRRVSLTTIDPWTYFPVWNAEDPTFREAVRIITEVDHPDKDNETCLRILMYWHDPENVDVIYREEALWEKEGWFSEDEAELIQVILPQEALPASITTIPVYHFVNDQWGEDPWGVSELRGLESIFQNISQSVTDESLALMLSGLGVYVTDAGRPVVNGREVDWVISPGSIIEAAGATMFKRVDGVTNVQPIQDHLSMLNNEIMQASGTSPIAVGEVDFNIAESGVALAIKFIPTLAKIEDRELAAYAKLEQMWFDLLGWFTEFEISFEGVEAVLTLGEKLPINRIKVLDELNQMLDRKVISRKFYRDEVARRLGYKFPTSIFDDILEEERQLMEASAAPVQEDTSSDGVSGPGGRLQGDGDTLPDDNQSNNANRTNESGGTEVTE